MSHNASPPRPGQIDTVSPTALAAAGTSTVTLAGKHFAPNSEPVIDAALGTLVAGSVVVTYPTSSTSQMVFDVVVSTPPAAATNRLLSIRHGGVAGPTTTIKHGFDPGDLLDSTTPDGMWYDSDDPISAHHVFSGTRLTDWSPAAGRSGPNAVLDCTIAGNDGWKAGTIGTKNAWITWSGSFQGARCMTLGDWVVGGNAPGIPWTVAVIVEVVGPSFWTTWRRFRIGLGLSMIGGSSSSAYNRKIYASLSDRIPMGEAHNDTAHNMQYDITAATGKWTVIGTWDGTENAGGLKLYVNGVDQDPNNLETNTVRGTQSATTRLDVDFDGNGPDGGGGGTDQIICGDIFAVERAITSNEAGILHDYWAAKFGF